MAGEETVKGTRPWLGRWQVETYAGNEEEPKPETPWREEGQKPREGEEDSEAVRGTVKTKCYLFTGWIFKQM